MTCLEDKLGGSPYSSQLFCLPRSHAADGVMGVQKQPSCSIFYNLLAQVVLQTNLLDGLELGLEPVNMFLFAPDHLFKNVAGRVVTHLSAVRDGLSKCLNSILFQLQVQLQMLLGVFPRLHGTQPLHVGKALQVKDVIHQVLGIFHLIQANFPYLLVQSLVAPVPEHAGLEHILVNSSKLSGQDIVQSIDDSLFCFHINTSTLSIV